jgi:hypothetical protein
VRFLHDPEWTRYWLEEISEFYRAGPFHRGALLQSGVSEGHVRYAIIAMKEEIAELAEQRPELVIVDPVFLTVAAVILRDIASGVEPAFPIGIFGDVGSGKTTMAFYLTAFLYGAALGLCQGSLGRFSVMEARWLEYPTLDCGLQGDSVPEQWEFLLDAVFYKVANLADTIREHAEIMRSGGVVKRWALLIDEAGAGYMGAAWFHIKRKRYSAASILAQIIRTAAPVVIVTAPKSGRIGAALRDVVKLWISMGRAVQVPEAALERYGTFPSDYVEAVAKISTPPRGIAERTKLQIGRTYIPRKMLRQPRWFYERHMEFRREIADEIEEVLEEIEGGERGAEEGE